MGDILFIVVAVFGFISLVGLGLAFAGGSGQTSGGRTAKRVAVVAQAGRGEARLRGPSGAKADPATARRKQILDNLKAIERQERKAKLTLQARIQQAGLSFSPKTFWIGSLVIGFVAAFAMGVVSHNPLMALGVGFVAGLGLPRWVLGFMCKGRLKKFTEEFPNAVDIIVRGIKSGLPVHDCLKVIAAESPEPLAGEFKRLVEGLGVGQDLVSAMDKMHSRMPTSEVKFFSIVMAIQQKTGGNLAEALGNLSTVLRARKLMREKIKAMSGEAVASAGIIGSLPPAIMVLVSLVSPTYMLPMFTDPRGHIALMIGGGLMGVGVFIMRRMINFKF